MCCDERVLQKHAMAEEGTVCAYSTTRNGWLDGLQGGAVRMAECLLEKSERSGGGFKA